MMIHDLPEAIQTTAGMIKSKASFHFCQKECHQETISVLSDIKGLDHMSIWFEGT